MKKKKKVIIIIAYIVISLGVLSAGLLLSDSLPKEITKDFRSFFSGIANAGKASYPVNIDDASNKNNENKNLTEIPDDMKAMWFDIYADSEKKAYSNSSEISAEIRSNLNYFDNYHTNALFIKPDINNVFGGVKSSTGESFDILREYISGANSKTYFTGLIIDDSYLYASDGTLSFDRIKYYITNYAFNSVILYSENAQKNSALYEAMSFVLNNVREVNPELRVGVVITPDAAAKYADEQTLKIMSSATPDFVFINAIGSTVSSTLPFASVMSWFNEFADYYKNTSFNILHRADFAVKSTGEWRYNYELADELRYMWDYQNLNGSCFYSLPSLKTNKNSFAQRTAYLIESGASDELKIRSFSVDSENNSVRFIGNATYGHKLLCGGEVASKSGGSFDVTYKLKPGLNTFDFFSCGKNQTYRIYNNSHIILSYYPPEDISVARDKSLTISAVCLKGFEVNFELNGKSYPMTESTTVSTDGIPDGYSVFSCEIKFTGESFEDIDLGNISIIASSNNNRETVVGGKVTLLKSTSESFFEKVLEFISSVFDKNSESTSQYKVNIASTSDGFKVSPYKDNGLGTSLMCRIYKDDTERLGPVGSYNTYQPDLSALAAGMMDYVKNITYSSEGYIRYELSSGISVYGTDCELINNAYTLPENNIVVNGVNETVSSTDIVLESDWFVPITVNAFPQKYYTGYLSYSYNVSNFTAEYVDIIFYHTASFYNQSSIKFDADSPFSFTELYTDNNGNMILRLHLKKAGQFYGFDISTDEYSRVIISFKKHSAASLAGKVIMLDPGHGGLAMPGTSLTDQTVCEATVTLGIASKVKQMLTQQGATVVMTRTMDTALDLEGRTKKLSETNPDIFVSIHCDGSNSTADSGTHTFYFRSYSQPLANAINTALVNEYETNIYTPESANYSSINRGIKYYPFYVTRLNQCPSVLVETGFMTNIEEGNLLANDNAQYWIAQGITYGIMNYFTENCSARY